MLSFAFNQDGGHTKVGSGCVMNDDWRHVSYSSAILSFASRLDGGHSKVGRIFALCRSVTMV
jgi:hypothetical protein